MKEEEERRKTAENSFQPTLIAGRTRAKRGYSKEAKLNSLIESGDNHIKRQLIGRKTKVERQDRLFMSLLRLSSIFLTIYCEGKCGSLKRSKFQHWEILHCI